LLARTAGFQGISDSLNDDLNTAEALPLSSRYVRDANSSMDSASSARGNAAAALQFRAASIPYSTSQAHRRERELSDAEIDSRYRGAHRGQESQKFGSPTRYATSF